MCVYSKPPCWSFWIEKVVLPSSHVHRQQQRVKRPHPERFKSKPMWKRGISIYIRRVSISELENKLRGKARPLSVLSCEVTGEIRCFILFYLFYFPSQVMRISGSSRGKSFSPPPCRLGLLGCVLLPSHTHISTPPPALLMLFGSVQTLLSGKMAAPGAEEAAWNRLDLPWPACSAVVAVPAQHASGIYNMYDGKEDTMRGIEAGRLSVFEAERLRLRWHSLPTCKARSFVCHKFRIAS